MIQQIDLTINVTDAARLGEPAQVAVTVTLPDPADLPPRPIIVFAKAGGGYSKGYFTHALPGPGEPIAQADWHAARGWITVSVDSLGIGGSSIHGMEKLGYAQVTAANHAAEQEILLKLANGLIAAGFPTIHEPVTIGIGHSMGGALTIVQQGRYHGYDGIGVLGFSAVHSHPAVPPGEAPVVVPWTPRDSIGHTPFAIINEAAVAAGLADGGSGALWRALAWGFHYDDVPHEVVSQDLAHFSRMAPGGDAGEAAPLAPWSSATDPGAIGQTILTPGVVAPEAAAVRVPVLCAMGERDFVIDPPGEARAFKSATSVDLFICPRMAHIHNFASTRALLWQRIDQFAAWCAVVKAAG